MTLDELRERCKADLAYYAEIVTNGERYFGDVHKEFFLFFQRSLEGAMAEGRENKRGSINTP